MKKLYIPGPEEGTPGCPWTCPAGPPPEAALAAYMLASSWAFPIFFLYLILLLPNQFDICTDRKEFISKILKLVPRVFVLLDQQSGNYEPLKDPIWNLKISGLKLNFTCQAFKWMTNQLLGILLRPFELLFFKPTKIDSVTELSRVTCFIKTMQ